MAPPVKGTATVETKIEPPALPEDPTATTSSKGTQAEKITPAPAEPSPKVIKTGETTVSVTPPDDRFVLRPGLSITPFAGIGGKNATLFDKAGNANTANSAFTFVDLSLAADFRLTRLGNWGSLFLGPRVAYQAHRGDRATGGSGMDLGQLTANFGLDWKNSMAGWSVLLPSRISLYGGLLYGAGETTAGEHFSVAPTRGFGYSIGAEADIFGVKVNKAGDSVQLSWYAETGHIPEARGPNPYSFWSTGPRLTVPLAWPGSIQKESRVDTLLCRADRPTLESIIGELKELQEKTIAEHEEFKRLASLLQKKGYSPEKILAALRTGYIKKLEASVSEDPSVKPQLEKAVSDALAAKKVEFEKTVAEDKSLKDQPAKDKKLAELNAAEKAKVESEFFASKKSEFETKAKTAYPDGYNHFELELPQVTELPEGMVLPTDCAESEALLDRLMQDRRALDIFRTRIEERTHFMYFALGKPTRNVVDALGGLGFAQFPPLNFVAGQPDYGKKNEGLGKRGPDMDKIEKFLEANKGKRFTANDQSLQRAFKGIFAGNELLALEDVVAQLNGEKPMRGVRASKMTPDQLKEMVQKIPVLIEAHVSITDGRTPDNQILSENRGRAVEIAMILLGINPDRLRSVGMGESNPIVPETLDWSKGGKRVKNLNWAREKNRRVMFWVDTDKLEAAESKLVGTVAAPKADAVPPAAAAQPPVATPPGAAVPPGK